QVGDHHLDRPALVMEVVDDAERLLGALRHDHLVRAAMQVGDLLPEVLQQGEVVVHAEDVPSLAGGGHGLALMLPTASFAAPAERSTTVKQVRPRRDSTVISAPTRARIRRARASPRPVPPSAARVVKNGVKSLGITSAGMPGPSSTNLTTICASVSPRSV